MEMINPSVIEHKINEKQLLCAALLQRNFLIMPRCSRDAIAYQELKPLYHIALQSFRFNALKTFFELTTPLHNDWLVMKEKFNSFSNNLYYVFSDSFSSLKKKVCNKNRFQFNEPFDLRMKKINKELRKEKWFFYLNYSYCKSTK
jgi:hypothetical protein